MLSFCSVSVLDLSSVLYFLAYTDVNVTVYPNCVNVPLRICSLSHYSLLASIKEAIVFVGSVKWTCVVCDNISCCI